MKKWLQDNFLPMWAKESVLWENRQLRKENQQLRQKIQELEAYTQGLQVGLRAVKRIKVNHGGQK